ncbi:hypothetical protein PUN28_017078 [Cardiocondyla obscurior]|uniref:Uncharacterized protein n=1 Tax=Cardiocondyla obscurior TaxID=286306 RepID=A0AAW2EMH7_9HYME
MIIRSDFFFFFSTYLPLVQKLRAESKRSKSNIQEKSITETNCFLNNIKGSFHHCNSERVDFDYISKMKRGLLRQKGDPPSIPPVFFDEKTFA